MEFYAGGKERYDTHFTPDSGIAVSTPEDARKILSMAEKHAYALSLRLVEETHGLAASLSRSPSTPMASLLTTRS